MFRPKRVRRVRVLIRKASVRWQDGCSGCQQRCATAFGDVDDILEEYCEDCYSVPVDDSDPCKRSGCLDSEGTVKL